MSFDVYVQGFMDSADRAAIVRATLGHLLDASGELITTADGSAEVYGLAESPTTGLMFTHVHGKEAWDAIYDVAAAADWVIMPVGTPVFVVDAAQTGSLPEELREGGVEVVVSGQQLREAVERA